MKPATFREKRRSSRAQVRDGVGTLAGGLSRRVGDLARQGASEVGIADELQVPLDLVRQIIDHLVRTGELLPLNVGSGCSLTACKGCFFSSACPSRG